MELDNIFAESNRISKDIGILMKSGERDKAEVLKSKTFLLKDKEVNLKAKLGDVTKRLQEELYKIPNTPAEVVLSGKNADDNEIIYQDSYLPKLFEGALPHWELAKKYNLIDFEAGVKIAGAGFPVYKGKGAKLQRALIRYFLDKNTSTGYDEVQVPHLVNEESGYGTGQLPDKGEQMYHVGIDGLYLIPTAEVPITIKEEDLPILNTGYTPCFRREAGSYGTHVRGLNRLHQFDKVELVRIEKPENSHEALKDMVRHVRGILQEMGLPFRIIRLCGGDMGFASALTYDFEVFSAAQDRWLEVSSVSNFETFQTNRLNLRYRNKEGNNRLLHTLNGSSLALPRILASILENYQTPSGIVIPEVLRKYTGLDIID